MDLSMRRLLVCAACMLIAALLLGMGLQGVVFGGVVFMCLCHIGIV